MKTKRVIYSALMLVFLFTLNVSVASAAEFFINKQGGNVVIGQDQEVKNPYIAGNIVSVDGDVEKSLYAVGNVVTISGDVGHNLNAGAGTVVIKGDVKGSVHAAGGSVVVEGKITDDLFIAGGNIILTKAASVGGDLIVAGGNIDIEGPVAGKLYIAGGELTLNNKVGGKTKIEIEKLVLGSQAEISSDLTYKSPEEADIDEAAKILGAVDFTKKEVGKAAKATKTRALSIIFSVLTIGFLIKVLITIVSGLILVYLLGKVTKPVVREALKNFWPNLGIGFASLILIPVAAVILAVTVIGLWLAGLISVVYVLLMFIASPLASIIFGTWLIRLFKKKSEKDIDWQEVVVGVIVLSIIGLIPLAGWLVCLVVFLVAFGALSRLTYKTVLGK